jgi:hypothetical protein
VCVYSISCDCGRCYIGETNRPLELRIKEHKYNLKQGLLEKSKLAQHAYVRKKRTSCRLNRTPSTGKTRNPPTCLWQLIRSVNRAWTSLPSGLPQLERKSENYNSSHFRLHGKVTFLCWYYSYTGSSVKYWSYLLLGSICYLEIFVCLKSNLR